MPPCPQMCVETKTGVESGKLLLTIFVAPTSKSPKGIFWIAPIRAAARTDPLIKNSRRSSTASVHATTSIPASKTRSFHSRQARLLAAMSKRKWVKHLLFLERASSHKCSHRRREVLYLRTLGQETRPERLRVVALLFLLLSPQP
mmetsp:Transcript_44667/g.105844  ORF Transcript_44667/g.105844 Transcript_44667/m.105844 type:complete len:145 (+) Transcript_44667:439-873(+)